MKLCFVCLLFAVFLCVSAAPAPQAPPPQAPPQPWETALIHIADFVNSIIRQFPFVIKQVQQDIAYG